LATVSLIPSDRPVQTTRGPATLRSPKPLTIAFRPSPRGTVLVRKAMNPKKKKEKDRRRARKLSDEAWEAANAGNLDLAERIIRRAVAAQKDNPAVWTDQGVLLAMRDKAAEAERCFRNAIRLSPTFTDAYAQLAALRAREGYLDDAVAWQTQAVQQSPQDPA